MSVITHGHIGAFQLTCVHVTNIFFASYYTVIETLTQHHLDFNKAIAACQHITWDENSSVSYLRQTILDSYIDYHATQEPTTLPGLRPL